MTTNLRDEIKQRRLERMRLGQAVADYVTLPSDPETRVAIVPLIEADYLNVLQQVSNMQIADDLAGLSLRDRIQAQLLLVYAIRYHNDLTVRVYETREQLINAAEGGLEQIDMDECYASYQEMIATASPSIDGIPPEEFENLKKVLQEMDWSALSGRQWYAAKRFLSAISPSPLLDNSPGYGSILKSTTTNDSPESTTTANQNS